jgi:hypothetical protein
MATGGATPLWQTPAHARATHERWRHLTHRDLAVEPGLDQCGICRFWAPLSGALGTDYGACTNDRSPCDRVVMFEHDGCDEHEAADEWNVPGS